MKLLISTGDPAGIGPDVSLTLAGMASATNRLVLLGDLRMLAQRAESLRLDVNLIPYHTTAAPSFLGGKALEVLHIPTCTKVVPGQADDRNAQYVLKIIDTAVHMCNAKMADGMVTAPVSKHLLSACEPTFSGHTEYIGRLCRCSTVMIMVADNLKVGLATTHIPLKEVASRLTIPALLESLRIVHRSLREYYAIANPCVAVCGLNPHAGEGGLFGDEENLVIRPAIAELCSEGLDISGPYSADSIFSVGTGTGPKFDLIFAMFHDQGLPVIKYTSFGKVVNVTLGLPFVRVSVDHGTAFDLAGSGRAKATSLHRAVQHAQDLLAKQGQPILERG